MTKISKETNQQSSKHGGRKRNLNINNTNTTHDCDGNHNHNIKKIKTKQNQSITSNHPNKINKSIEDVEDQVNNLKHSDPVLQLHLPSLSSSSSSSSKKCTITQAPDITFDDTTSNNNTSLLEKILYPLLPTTFLTTCFRKKAVYIQSNYPDRVNNLISKYMFSLDARQIFEETSSDSVFLWIPSSLSSNNDDNDNENLLQQNSDDDHCNYKTSSSSPKPLQSIELQDPEMAYLLHTSSNYASYCRAPPELEQPLVFNMLKDTGIGCGQYETFNDDDNNQSFMTSLKTKSMGRGEVETFIGTKDHITDWHIDFQENFTIQLSGSKKWYLKQSTLKHPLRGVTPHYKSTKDVIENQLLSSKLSTPNFVFGKQDVSSNAFGDEVEVVMNPGDILYFPAGMWHKVETLEYGVSINISLMGSNYASIVCGALEHVLLQREEWREIICNKNTGTTLTNHDSKSNETNVVIEKLDSLIRDLPDIIRDFQQNGGAQCILPPVLRRAPNYVIDNDYQNSEAIDELDLEQRSEGGNSEDSEDIEHSVEESIDFKEVDDDVDHENESSDEIPDEDDVIDIKYFKTVDNYERPSPQHKLVKNPLAALMKMVDVTSFDSKGHQQDENKYILNVCYVGNEQHEPNVRAILFDDSGLLKRICDIERSGNEELSDMVLNNLTDLSLLDALFYYGYFNWI